MKKIINLIKDEYLFIAILIIIIIAPISGISFWGDEAWTVYHYGMAETFGSLINRIATTIGGDAQFPGYNIYMWIWMKIIPNKEIFVRYSNLPLFILLIIYLRFGIKGSKSFKLGYILLICINPMIWYYLNEARYPIIVFSIAAVNLFSLISFFNCEGKSEKTFHAIVFTISIILGIYFIMLYYFYIPTLLVIALYLIREKGIGIPRKTLWTLLTVQLVFIILFGVYYAYTIIQGSGGQRLRPSVVNIIFSIYEYLGYLGIGPARNILRAEPGLTILKPFLIPLVVITLTYASIFLLILKYTNFKKITIEFVGLFGFFIGLSAFYIGALLFDFKFLARHIIFFYVPFSFYIYSIFYKNVLKKNKRTGLIFMIVLLLIYVYSCINIRFDPYYQKEDYRMAANLAKEYAKESNSDIIWYGDYFGGKYYDIGAENTQSPFQVEFIGGLREKCLEDLQHFISGNNTVVIFQRHDYDGEIDDNLKKSNYQILFDHKDFNIYGNTISGYR